ncbi:hypothetical protein [Paraburkholderia phytofirmans]|uniref:hypothetical protein n=1 Tax=Paraburkholderia phytofirmans TaxID=261302 RepID=UPI0038B71601
MTVNNAGFVPILISDPFPCIGLVAGVFERHLHNRPLRKIWQKVNPNRLKSNDRHNADESYDIQHKKLLPRLAPIELSLAHAHNMRPVERIV